MVTPLTSDQLDKALRRIGTQVETTEARLSESIRGVNEHLVKLHTEVADLQTTHAERLVRLETKIDAVLEEVSTRRELRRLVCELKGKGIDLNEALIFADGKV